MDSLSPTTYLNNRNSLNKIINQTNNKNNNIIFAKIPSTVDFWEIKW